LQYSHRINNKLNTKFVLHCSYNTYTLTVNLIPITIYDNNQWLFSKKKCLGVDWYRGYRATTLWGHRHWASRPFVRRHLVPETSVSEERKWARNVREFSL
jgi:hypothetical protein